MPYFVIHSKDTKLDGSNPTILHSYGGYEIALTPYYDPLMATNWLEQGGVYVIGNIRGGGEYGPKWHQAALKEKRHKAYEDFEAVARDLIARGVTSPPRLGIMGGSNGGLLVGNMLVRTPGSAPTTYRATALVSAAVSSSKMVCLGGGAVPDEAAAA